MPRSRSRGKVRTHIKAYLADRRFHVVAACDSNSSRLKRFCAHWKIPSAYKNLESMLATELPDVVSVCTPTSTHLRVLGQISRHPVRCVFAEKPFTASFRDAESVLKKFRARKISVAVNYLRRWCPNHRKLKQIIDSGRLGRLRTFDAIYTGDLENIGSHLIDLVNFLAGTIVSVRGMTGGKTGELTLQSGVTGYLEHSRQNQFELQLLFDRGLIQICEYGYKGECQAWRRVGQKAAAKVLFRFSNSSRGIDSAMKHAVGNIGDHLLRGSPLSSGGKGAVKVLAVCSALSRSAVRQGRVVPVSP